MKAFILLFSVAFYMQSDPIKLEYISSFKVQEGYNYELIHISDRQVVYQEFFTKAIISTNFDGSESDTLKIPIGRGPGENSGAPSPIKANNDFLYVLDRSQVKILQFSLPDFKFITETYSPVSPWQLSVNDRVFVRSLTSEKFIQEISFQNMSFTGLSAAVWTESNPRFPNVFAFEAHDVATNSHLFMVKHYDPVYYVYDLEEHSLRLIRFEKNTPIDFSNSDFFSSLRLHIKNVVLLDNGRLLGIQGYGNGSNGRAYQPYRIHLFESLSGEYVGKFEIPNVDIELSRMVSNDKYLAILDSKSNQIKIYKYYLNE